MADGREDSPQPGFNNFSNDGSFLESFMKLQQEKKPESASESKPKAKPLPPIRKPLIMKMGKKKPPVLVKPKATVAVLEGNSPKELDKQQERTGDGRTEDVSSRKGEMSLPTPTLG